MENLDFQYSVDGLEVSFVVITKVPRKAVFSWDFGDDTGEYNKKSPNHTYEKSGFYTVTLEISTSEDGIIATAEKLLIVSDITNTHLTGSIYTLINEYIPKELSDPMTSEQKAVFINKWQLYIHPLVRRPRGKEIPKDKYNDELYYEGLENQLIMELAAWDYLNVKILNLLTGTGQYLREMTSSGSTGDDSNFENTRGDRVKHIQTGPTEVDYYDTLSESASALFKAYSQAIKPGGILDEFKKNLCMLAERIGIYLPFCNLPYTSIVPKVVNRRDPGILGGPNPTAPIKGNGVTLIPK